MKDKKEKFQKKCKKGLTNGKRSGIISTVRSTYRFDRLVEKSEKEKEGERLMRKNVGMMEMTGMCMRDRMCMFCAVQNSGELSGIML